MELTSRISGKCQVILIPGERRELGLVGVEIRDGIAVEFFADDTTVPVEVEGFFPQERRTGVVIIVPTKIDISRAWSGRVKLGEEVFCEFEVKFLDAEKAKSLGWE